MKKRNEHTQTIIRIIILTFVMMIAACLLA